MDFMMEVFPLGNGVDLHHVLVGSGFIDANIVFPIRISRWHILLVGQ
jgi:hypothetical protein